MGSVYTVVASVRVRARVGVRVRVRIRTRVKALCLQCRLLCSITIGATAVLATAFTSLALVQCSRWTSGQQSLTFQVKSDS